MVANRSRTAGDGRPTRPAGCALVPIISLLLLATALQAQIKYSGGSGTPENPYLIGTVEDLLALGADPTDWSSHFRLTADIDMNDVPKDTVCTIGTVATPFRGSFDGAGKRILHFTCISPDRNRVGLFGHIRALGGGVHDLCLVEPNVVATTGVSVGCLVGHLGTGTVSGCRVERGHVRGAMAVGGLVGWNYATIERSEAQAEVHGQYSVGGLVGLCGWDAQVRECAADANVAGVNCIGGLAGSCIVTILQWSWAEGCARGSSNIGGLVGSSEGATISNCYSLASVEGASVVGGLVGLNDSSTDSDNGVFPGLIRNCYSVGLVTGREDVGGLLGLNEPDCVVDACFWDIDTSGVKTSARGTGLPTAPLQTPSTFVRAGWNFSQDLNTDDGWLILQEPQYPTFTWQPIKAISDPNTPQQP